MDIQMPEMDGLSAATAIRALPGGHGGCPVVAVTANAMVGDRERYLAAGFDDYLAKPLHIAQLQAVVARWTNGPSAQAAARSMERTDGAGEHHATVREAAATAGSASDGLLARAGDAKE